MIEYYEIDFLNVGDGKSGDSILVRYKDDLGTHIHVIDGGFQATSDIIINHITEYYNSPDTLDAVVVSHPDGDHTGGLRKLFEKYTIKELFMLRPWIYVDELIERFSRFQSKENLVKRLKEIYPNLKALEDLAKEYDVKISEPFQGSQIGPFTVLSPSKKTYLNLVVESEKTPESERASAANFSSFGSRLVERAISFIKSLWGEESFPSEDTSNENNMSIVQYGNMKDKILLTADAGRLALNEALDYFYKIEPSTSKFDRIQIPHHGSRHNVSTELLDRMIGPVLPNQQDYGQGSFSAIVSASKNDEKHPRKVVLRAFHHRGARVYSNEDNTIRSSNNAPPRNWSPATVLPYPEEQEE